MPLFSDEQKGYFYEAGLTKIIKLYAKMGERDPEKILVHEEHTLIFFFLLKIRKRKIKHIKVIN